MSKLKGFKSVKNTRLLSALWTYRRHLPSMMREVFRGTYKLSTLTFLAIVASAIYILSPIDILPDVIPILGWTDDGIVFYFLLKRLLTETEMYLNKKEQSDPSKVIVIE